MSGDRWTLLLLKDGESPVQQFSVSPRAVRVAVGACLALIPLFAILAALAIRDSAAGLEAERLRRENMALASQIQRFESDVAALEGTLEKLSERSDQVRRLAGLEPIDADVLKAGVGGPGLDLPQSHPLWAVDSVVGKSAFAVTYDLNALERRADLLSVSMSEASDSLHAHHDLLQSTPSILPAAGLLSSAFTRERYHPIHHQALPHEGIDVAAPEGTPIMAAAKGKVLRAGWTPGYGRMVEIDHGFGFVTRYGHASKLLVRVGQDVARGEVIAQVGSSGIATAPHLHYEVRVNGRARNPINYILSGAVP